MILYHVTSSKAVEAIERVGFRDNTGFYMTEQEFTGVWISDVPLTDQYAFSDVAVFEIDSQSETLSEWEWVPDLKNYYREWLVPAAVLNRMVRRRVFAVNGDLNNLFGRKQPIQKNSEDDPTGQARGTEGADD